MPTPEINEFAKILMTEVRDDAVETCDWSREPSDKTEEALRWRQKIKEGDIDALIAEIIPDCVDRAIAKLLLAIDGGELKLSFTSKSGKTIDLTDVGNGELTGWFMGGGKDGWRQLYCKQRFQDDVATAVKKMKGEFPWLDKALEMEEEEEA